MPKRKHTGGEEMMEVQVSVHMKTQDPSQSVSFTCRGEWGQKGGVWYLQYREPDREMGDTVTIIKIEEDTFASADNSTYDSSDDAPPRVTLIRRGTVVMRHLFLAGKETQGIYHHPYGAMNMLTLTRHIDFKRRSHFARLKWEYDLTLDGKDIGRYIMSIEIKGGTTE